MVDFSSFIPEELKRLAKYFPNENRLYIVGGYVRDAIEFNKASKDIDLACSLTPDQLTILLKDTEFTICEASQRLGTMIIKGARSYEYTTFRVDSYPNGIGVHEPTDVIFTNDILVDASRRDFKCNAIYFDILKNKIVDPLNGLKDIEDKMISTVIDPQITLSQDGLRIMRLVRMVSTLGYSVEQNTLQAAAELVDRLKDISVERIQIELMKILDGNHCYEALCLMRDLGVLEIILPEIAKENGVPQNPKYHKYDVLEHTFKTVEVAPKDIRLAALFHDVGKPYCLERDGNMYLHGQVGAEITKDVLKRMKFSNDIIDFTVELVAAHMFDVADNAKVNTIRKFISEHPTNIDHIVELQIADAIGTGLVCGPLRNSRTHDQVLIMKERGLPFSLKELKINGTDLLRIGFKGKQIGNLLFEMQQNCLQETIKNERDSLLQYADRKWRKLNGNS